jgi:hypothetical protein
MATITTDDVTEYYHWLIETNAPEEAFEEIQGLLGVVAHMQYKKGASENTITSNI